jgi:hypothetical protein
VRRITEIAKFSGSKYPALVPYQRFADFDFGLTHVANGFHQDWTLAGSVEDVARLYLPGPAEAAALADDVAQVLGSPLSDDQVSLLWVAATDGFTITSAGLGRDILRRIGAACHEWQREFGAVPPEDSPDWHTPQISARVREAISGATLKFGSRDEWKFATSNLEAVSRDVRQALELLAWSVTPDLAFRFLLQVHLGSWLTVDKASWTRYERLAAGFSYGEFLLSSLDHLVEDQ